MSRGRPAYSQIRQNIVEILFFLGKSHGYDIYKAYIQVFPKITMRSVYYQLKRGTEMGLFAVDEIKKEKGEYSWGKEAEKTIYKLGPDAKPTGEERVAKHFKKDI